MKVPLICLCVALLAALATATMRLDGARGPVGVWKNELGSLFNVTRVFYSTGRFEGVYASAVGDACGWYPAVGVVYTDSASGALLMAWSVAWSNGKCEAHSVTAWSGQLYDDTELRTTWLLSTEQERAADSWASTRVSTDVFVRVD